MALRFLFLAFLLLAAGAAVAVGEPLCANVPGADVSAPGEVSLVVQFGGAGGCAAPPCFHLREDGARVNLGAFGGREFVVQPSGLLTGCLNLPA